METGVSFCNRLIRVQHAGIDIQTKKGILRVYTLEATLLKKIAHLACLFFRVKRPGINIGARVRS